MKKLSILTIFALLFVAVGGFNAYALSASPELLSKMETFNEEKAAIKAEIKAVLDANADATREEKSAAVKAWREANSTRLAAQRTLKKEIMREIRQIMKSKKTELKSLSPEERKAAMKKWREENPELAAFLKAGPNAEIARLKAKVKRFSKMMEKELEKLEKKLKKSKRKGRKKGDGKAADKGNKTQPIGAP